MKNILLTILLASTIWSCGSRKVNKSKTAEKATSEIVAKTETKLKTDTHIQNDVVQEINQVSKNEITEFEESLEPINPDLPMEKIETSEGGTKKITYKNAKVGTKLRSDNSKSDIKSTYTDKSKLSEQSDFSDLSESDVFQSMENTKAAVNVDAKRGFNWWWILALLIPLGYIYYKVK